MDLSNLTLFQMVKKRMGWLTKRQEVLAQNIANSDTPKYVPHDLKAQKFREFMRTAPPPQVARAEMRMTSANHLEPTRRPPKFDQNKDKKTYEIAPAGNAVIVEEQLIKVNETQGHYRLATNLYQKHVRMLKMAIGRDRG